MAVTFEQARTIVTQQHGGTLPKGTEDTDHFVVYLEEPLYDIVPLVAKTTGKLSYLVVLDNRDKLRQMTPIEVE